MSSSFATKWRNFHPPFLKPLLKQYACNFKKIQDPDKVLSLISILTYRE